MRDGILLHAKHAYMPNSLGYCGPDDRGRILQHLEDGADSESLVKTLKEFEAAYPFLKLIAKSSGRDPFEFAVPEAYWIGNSLLDSVPASDFYTFSHRDLLGRDPEGVRRAFKALDGEARPHHSFYVMSTFASESIPDGPRAGIDKDAKIGKMIDECRISWGEVTKVGPKTLKVESPAVELAKGRIRISRPIAREVLYHREVKPFSMVKPGDIVSLHWGFACEVLSPRQVRNIKKFTDLDVLSANRLLRRLRRSG